jgi:hypothetical protein
MYSPKIREDLIPRIYRAAKSAKVAMTAWVNQVIEQALPPEAEEKDPETNGRKSEKGENNYERDRIGEKGGESGDAHHFQNRGGV